MKILKIVDGSPVRYSEYQLHAENPDVSFPSVLSADLLAAYGCFEYSRPSEPTFDPLIEIISDGAFEVQEDGSWALGWSVDRISQEVAERNVRNERQRRLRETDDYTLAQLTTLKPMPLEISQYQTALRDVPQQAGFPYSVTWPTKPGIL